MLVLSKKKKKSLHNTPPWKAWQVARLSCYEGGKSTLKTTIAPGNCYGKCTSKHLRPLEWPGSSARGSEQTSGSPGTPASPASASRNTGSEPRQRRRRASTPSRSARVIAGLVHTRASQLLEAVRAETGGTQAFPSPTPTPTRVLAEDMTTSMQNFIVSATATQRQPRARRAPRRRQPGGSGESGAGARKF